MVDISEMELKRLVRQDEELSNFKEIAVLLAPHSGDMPEVEGIDVYGISIPYSGELGGDHIIYVDFKKRYDIDARITRARERGQSEVAANLEKCRHMAGIALADVSGHKITDALLSLMLHQAFLLGSIYELDLSGEITTRLFEHLNTRFYKSSSVHKFVTLIYGEISEDGRFRFMSAAQPIPVVFSRKFDRIVDIHPDSLETFPPIGTIPSYEDIDRNTTQTVLGFKERYTLNEINLMGHGDILLLYTDGLFELSDGRQDYFPDSLEDLLRRHKDNSARQIAEALKIDILSFSRPHDDVSFVVIKKD
ncbi:MAG: PP2C family protein-serine/threonine phosphatase [Acidobacteriota bacterium]